MTAPAPAGVQVCLSHRYSASAEKLFDAWLCPGQASRFLFATRTGCVTQCEIDPVEGGRFVVTDRRPLAEGDESVMDVVHHGRYLQVQRPHRLVFEFGVAGFDAALTRVSLAIEPLGPQTCELTLHHDLGDSAEAGQVEAATRRGWQGLLEALERELFPRRAAVG